MFNKLIREIKKPFNVFLSLRIHRIYISFMLVKIQICKGISSEVVGQQNKHYLFFDLENCTLEQAKQTLSNIQIKNYLADIFITSDKDKSYRGFCFSIRTLKDYLRILLDTNHVDWSFIVWTLRRQKAIIRTQTKINRQPQQLICVLEGFEDYTIPEKFIKETYETGYTKLPQSIRNYRR